MNNKIDNNNNNYYNISLGILFFFYQLFDVCIKMPWLCLWKISIYEEQLFRKMLLFRKNKSKFERSIIVIKKRRKKWHTLYFMHVSISVDNLFAREYTLNRIKLLPDIIKYYTLLQKYIIKRMLLTSSIF